MLSKMYKTLQNAKAARFQRIFSSVCCRGLQSSSPNIIISQELKEAIAFRHPVVALESTIITHGMPYPHNLKTALAVENIIKEEGALPATIGILNGKVHVGLTQEQLCILAEKKSPCVKTSRRDFPYVLAKGINGGTTVSGTMLIAHKVGIPLFVTGGIGGVHRGAECSMDISADLTELGRTPMTVVSAGVKSILDVGRTLEYLETQGVCVTVLGPDSKFPDFFTRDSGHKAPSHIDTPALAALMMKEWTDLYMNSGMLIAVPIPSAYEAEGQQIKDAIETAVDEASSAVSGRDVTPYILQRVFEITGGESLKSNIALIENNAEIGAQISVEYSRLRQPSNSCIPARGDGGGEVRASKKEGRPVVVGGSIVDFVAMVREPKIEFNGMTHKGHIRQSYGGVGRNLGDALSRLQCRPVLISAVGNDNHARALTTHNPLLDCGGLARIDGASTATYCAILDSEGEALFGIGDMAIHNCVSPEHVRQFETEMASAPLVILDGNVSLQTISYVLDHCASCKVPVWYEPTDVQKAAKPWLTGRGENVAFTSPNLNELKALCSHLGLGDIGSNSEKIDDLPALLKQIVTTASPIFASETMRAIMVTLDRHGFMILRKTSPGKADEPLLNGVSSTISDKTSSDLASVIGLHFQQNYNQKIVSVSGAGDCLAAAFICGMLQGNTVSECSALGLAAAGLSLEASPAVPDTLNSQILPWGTKQPFALIRS